MSVTDVNGSGANVGTFVAGAYGSLLVFSGGFYLYQANANLDLLPNGQTGVDNFTFTVTDTLGRSETTTLTINVFGTDDAATIISADANGSITEDAGPSVIVNGGFESGNLGGWSATSPGVSVQFAGFGGELGNYAARLDPTASPESLFQDIATTAGQHYVLSFYVSGDAEATSNSMTVTWDGMTVLAVSDQFGGLTRYTFDVVAVDSSSTLQFTYTDDGVGMYVDAVTVSPTPGPATETADGTITFADIETGDTHTASFVAQGSGYVGTFSLDPVSESSGSGSLDWHFTVDNADIQYLAQNQSVSQIYTVMITGDGGAVTFQDVTVTLNGTNDAPTTVGADNVITNADVNGGFFIPTWALTINDADPDLADTLSVNSITGTSGLDAFLFGGVLAFDDAVLGGSFTYDTTDGLAVSSGSGTVTVTNNAAAVSTLNGTSGNDILIGTTDGVALDGGGGNDILIGNSGAHALTGGSGDDIFAFQVVPDALNSITDFDNVGAQDKIAISAAAFGGGVTPGMDTTFLFESTADAEFLGSLFHYDTSTDTLYFSSDGTTASAIVVAQLQAGVLLNSNDLLIV